MIVLRLIDFVFQILAGFSNSVVSRSDGSYMAKLTFKLLKGGTQFLLLSPLFALSCGDLRL